MPHEANVEHNRRGEAQRMFSLIGRCQGDDAAELVLEYRSRVSISQSLADKEECAVADSTPGGGSLRDRGLNPPREVVNSPSLTRPTLCHFYSFILRPRVKGRRRLWLLRSWGGCVAENREGPIPGRPFPEPVLVGHKDFIRPATE